MRRAEEGAPPANFQQPRQVMTGGQARHPSAQAVGAPVGAGAAGARRQAPRRPPASRAFDAKRYQDMVAAKQKQVEEAKRKAEEAQKAAETPEPAPAQFEGVGRNDACPCGSGKKFKKCHGKSA